MPTSLQQQRWIVQQRRPATLLQSPAPDAAVLREAAGIVAAMSDELPNDGLRSPWSRARTGHPTNPFYRAFVFFRALRKMGGSYADAWLALAWLIGKVDGLWADANLCVKQAHAHEVQADADEDVMQFRFVQEPAAKAAYREKLVRQLAAGHALLAALDAESSGSA